MNYHFDVIVIGTGAAGSTIAYECKAAGWEVGIIDSNPFGGTCANRGCDPKKVLISAAEAVDWVRRMEGKGITADHLRIDWSRLMEFKRTFTDPVPGSNEEGFQDFGITAFQSRAQFIDVNTLQVGQDTLTGDHFAIASGARPATLEIPGEEHLTTSEQFLELDELPKSIVFVGGGYISFEFAHLAARAGAKVQILHRGDRPLAGFDPDLVDQLVEATRALGIEVHLGTSVDGIEMVGDHLVVVNSNTGKKVTFETEMVVHGAGRVPDIDDMALETIGVQRNQKGVLVNQFLQSISNPNVYAAGDAAATNGPPLTPIAGAEGAAVAKNLLEGNTITPDYVGVPTVVFTIPALASVGLSEEDARGQGLKFRVNRQETSGWQSNRRVGSRFSGSKVLIEEGSSRILGAHLLGPHAEEVINLFSLAIRAGATADDLGALPYAFPTSSSDVSSMV